LSAADSRTGWVTPTLRVADVDVGFADMRRQVADDVMVDDALADEPKWPTWKVTVAVVVFCGAFWSGVGYLAVRLFG
jgi:hypothetical protein